MGFISYKSVCRIECGASFPAVTSHKGATSYYHVTASPAFPVVFVVLRLRRPVATENDELRVIHDDWFSIESESVGAAYHHVHLITIGAAYHHVHLITIGAAYHHVHLITVGAAYHHVHLITVRLQQNNTRTKTYLRGCDAPAAAHDDTHEGD
ncbi:hypothetical protein LSAT2_015793 [Lamellibrachia satsuma]|nr:hypothetical protein LSAT2_015793 [Lamellibrachia satsuma]